MILTSAGAIALVPCCAPCPQLLFDRITKVRTQAAASAAASGLAAELGLPKEEATLSADKAAVVHGQVQLQSYLKRRTGQLDMVGTPFPTCHGVRVMEECEGVASRWQP